MAQRRFHLGVILGADQQYLRVPLRRLSGLLIGCVVVRSWRYRAREALDDVVIRFHGDKIQDFLRRYPEVVRERDTIAKLATQRCSIARFGDGEFNICIGMSIGFQEYDPELASRLRAILVSKEPGVLVGISTFCTIDDLTPLMKKFVIRKGNRVLGLFDGNAAYESSTITTIFPREPHQLEQHLTLLRKVWEGRKVLFIVGEKSRFFLEPELFDNIAEHIFLYGPAKNAYREYARLLATAKSYDRDWLIMISLGPTATILAYDLALAGYQAIDLGHTPSRFRQAKYGPGSSPAELASNR